MSVENTSGRSGADGLLFTMSPWLFLSSESCVVHKLQPGYARFEGLLLEKREE